MALNTLHHHQSMAPMMWAKTGAKTRTIRTRPMVHHRGWGEVTITQSNSGKTYRMDSTLYGFANGPMVFDLINHTALGEQLADFVYSRPTDKRCRFRPWSAEPSMTSPKEADVMRFAEYLIKRWDELLSSYPNQQALVDWQKQMFQRPITQLPPWIPESFRSTGAPLNIKPEPYFSLRSTDALPFLCTISADGNMIHAQEDHDAAKILTIDWKNGLISSNAWDGLEEEVDGGDGYHNHHIASGTYDAYDIAAITATNYFNPRGMLLWELAAIARLLRRGVKVDGYWLEECA